MLVSGERNHLMLLLLEGGAASNNFEKRPVATSGAARDSGVCLFLMRDAGWEPWGGVVGGGGRGLLVLVVVGLIFAGRVRPSSPNSSEAEAGNGLLPFCLASVLRFIREEQNRQRITIGKL